MVMKKGIDLYRNVLYLKTSNFSFAARLFFIFYSHIVFLKEYVSYTIIWNMLNIFSHRQTLNPYVCAKYTNKYR